ncbi:MAG TPA: hypothetical protein VJT50_00855 [Pyrinomonadaceae bacterium]|nr:hypothetical protein [Pyrinomonadaceae bacterium]
MRRQSAWLAASMLFFAVLACNLGKNTNRNGNDNSNNSRTEEATSGSAIKEIHMAKDNGEGQPGDRTDTFSSSDRTIHCVATLNEAKSGTEMRFSWWIVDADGTQNKKIKDIDYTTKTLENVIHGHLTLPQDWPSGRYKVQVYVNGNLDKTVQYSVE